MALAGRRQRREGYTLIELLVVTLVLSVLMAVALPLYLSAVEDSEIKTCRHNMWSIVEAEQAYKVKYTPHQFTTDLSQLVPDMGRTPSCPRGGTYSAVISDGTHQGQSGGTVPRDGLIIVCSVPAHGVYAPGVDSH